MKDDSLQEQQIDVHKVRLVRRKKMYPVSLIPACTRLFLNPITILCHAKAPEPRQNNGILGGIGLTSNKY